MTTKKNDQFCDPLPHPCPVPHLARPSAKVNKLSFKTRPPPAAPTPRHVAILLPCGRHKFMVPYMIAVI